jgi:hypothetical protein
MIFDFPVFLNTFIPMMSSIMQVILFIAGTIAMLEWWYGFKTAKWGYSLTRSSVVYLVAANVLMQLVTWPCSDVGANCWKNCFGFTVIGNIGYATSYVMILLIVVIAQIFWFERVQPSFAIPAIYLYGIFGFLQIGYLDKGLWCIVRSSGYLYLWNSFEILILIQWIVYFCTLSLLYLHLMTTHETKVIA